MGTKLKVLSSDEVVTIFRAFGFSVQSQRGSHIKLRRDTSREKQILIIPHHKSIPKGTLKAILNQASHYIASTELEPHFYNV